MSRRNRDDEIITEIRQENESGKAEWETVSVTRPAKASMVYSIRFSGNELSQLRALADRERMRISDIVHEAISIYLAWNRYPAIETALSAPGVVNLYQAARRPSTSNTAVGLTSTLTPVAAGQ